MNQIARPQRGFTLIELLVVISIILLLATFGLTKLMGARRDAEMAKSKDNLGQIYAHLVRYENKKTRLPRKSGSEFPLAIWGNGFLDKSVNNAEIFFCGSLGLPPDMTDDTLEEDVTPETIHWAGRNQDDKAYRFNKLSGRDSSKTILVCNKPMVDGDLPHQGNALAVLYANGKTGQIERDAFGVEEGEPLLIGAESPVEALQGLVGAPGDEY